jgi:hypothetical protein
MSANTTVEDMTGDFVARLTNRPAFLFLGQAYLGLGSNSDPFFTEVARKYAGGATAVDSYSKLVRAWSIENAEEALSWMDERCRRITLPASLDVIAGLQWSGVLSSAIDSIWPRAFRNEWRQIQPIFEEKYRPSDPRNRSILHCMALFGSVNRFEEGERPPLNGFELAKRRQIAVGLARRLPELITPIGTIAIEGYAPNQDWFAADDLWSVIDELGAGQAHLFSTTDQIRSDPFAAHLLETGKLISHRESLAATLQRASESGFLRLGQPPEAEIAGRRLSLSDGAASIPTDLWNQVSRSAVIVDDSAILPPAQLSPDLRYREFREFLASADGQPNWQAYAQGFAFQRAYQSEVTRRVQDSLATKETADEPVILHGQTGTGKTVALSELAYSIRRAGRFPVLFIEKRPQRPQSIDLDRFCKWCEDHGAEASLVVWDGMLDPEEYSDLLRYLAGRGRKVTLVGSCYRLSANRSAGSRFVGAPPELTPDEVRGFVDFLRTFDESLGAAVDVEEASHDYTFLAALYRLLPPTRRQLRSGVAREVGRAEQVIIKRSADSPVQPVAETALALALQRAGLLSERPFLSPAETEAGVPGIEDLTGLVMVPGRFGLPVPFELVLRVLGKPAFRGISRLFNEVDVFRWEEDTIGNISLGPRNALEARLLVQARMGGAKTEVAVARRLLLEVRDDQVGPVEGREIRFSVDLLRAMGAQGRESSYFAPYFNELAETLRELRTTRGVQNPRLMLQEANLLREWAVGHAKAGDSDERIVAALREVEEVLRAALELVSGDKRSRSLRSALTVELGSVLASKARFLVEHQRADANAARVFNELRDALAEARRQDPANYYPVDVLAWATRDMLDADVLSGEQRVEAIAEVLYAFQSSDPNDFRADQLERFQGRRMEFAAVISDADIEADAFEQLRAQGSAAGFYLKAVRLAGLIGGNARMDPSPGQARDALNYLRSHRVEIGSDLRSLNLLFDLWWRTQAGSRLFEKERAVLPLNESQWVECLGLLDSLQEAGESYRATTLAFVRGLALFHLASYGESIEIFRDVERDSDLVRGKRRIVRSYLASTASARPTKFHGTVAWIHDSLSKGEVYVEELRRKIQFIPKDFGRTDFARGDSLGDFHIAFNFLGPLADPVGYYRP